jgi:hypothetical protein
MLAADPYVARDSFATFSLFSLRHAAVIFSPVTLAATFFFHRL